MKILATLALVGAFALSAAAFSPAIRAADEHAHGHGAAPMKLQLDHGKKWKTDEALRRGMSSIRETVHGAPAPLVRGDDLARELGIDPGPRLGDLLAGIAEAQYAGEVTTAAQAVDEGRRLLLGDAEA